MKINFQPLIDKKVIRYLLLLNEFKLYKKNTKIDYDKQKDINVVPMDSYQGWDRKFDRQAVILSFHQLNRCQNMTPYFPTSLFL